MKEPTAMRLAFERAFYNKITSVGINILVGSALKRGVGLATRKQMWSVTRGGR